MDREGFRSRLKQYKEAREQNPQLKYWEWKAQPVEKELPKYAEGEDEIMGPPTEAEWRRSLIKDQLWMHPDYYMAHSLAASKAALQQATAKLYEETPDMDRSIADLIKNDPSWEYYRDEVWANENPNQTGYVDGKWYPHKSPEGGARTIGPGFKLNNSKNNPSSREAKRGMTTDRLNQYLYRHHEDDSDYINDWINVGDSINASDTISPQIKMGLMDVLHQVGPTNMQQYNNLRDAVKEGNLDNIKKESTVIWTDKKGRTRVDERRKKLRDTKYFHYAEGTDQVDQEPLVQELPRSEWPTAEELYDRVRLPFDDLPLSGTDPLAENMLIGMTGIRITPMLRKLFPHYGGVFGAMMFGDDGKNNMLVVSKDPTSLNVPIKKNIINKDVQQYFADDVLPRDVVTSKLDKQKFLNNEKNFQYDLYPQYHFNENAAGYYDKYKDVIAINNKYTGDKDLVNNIITHEVNHRYDAQYPLDKEHSKILNRAYTVEKDAVGKAVPAARKQTEKRATNANIRHKLYTELRNTLGKKPTKEDIDKYIDSIPDSELLDKLGTISAYGSIYRMSIEDRQELQSNPVSEYRKRRATQIRKALKRIAMNETENDNNQNYA